MGMRVIIQYQVLGRFFVEAITRAMVTSLSTIAIALGLKVNLEEDGNL